MLDELLRLLERDERLNEPVRRIVFAGRTKGFRFDSRFGLDGRRLLEILLRRECVFLDRHFIAM
ncbi:hypothetical protein AJ87_22485 [Rhizobium yanglingense]|nr:hypothetical protein AJ87_22485 [Rhizobium yanglingense]